MSSNNSELSTFEVTVSALAGLFVQAMDATLVEMKDINPESEAGRDTFMKEVLEKVRLKINEGFMDEIKIIHEKQPKLYVPGDRNDE